MRNHLIIYERVYFGFFFFFSVPLVYIPVPDSFDYSSFVVSFEIRKSEYYNFVLLFQNCFSYLGWFSPFITRYYHSLSLSTPSNIKSVLSDISIATSAPFCLLFTWNIFFYFFTFSFFFLLFIRSKWVFYRQHFWLGSLIHLNLITIRTYFCHFAIF